MLHQELLLLGLLRAQVGLDVLDVLDGLGVGVAHLGRVGDARHHVIKAVGVEDDGRKGHVAGLVAAADTLSKYALGLLELVLLLGNLGIGGVEVRLGLVDLLAGLLGLGVQIVKVAVGLVELSLQVSGGDVGIGGRGRNAKAGRGDGRRCNNKSRSDLRHAVTDHE